MNKRRSSLRLATLLAAVLAVLTATVGTAGPGIPVSSCGTTLSAPGNYQLTGNLACAAGNGVNITGSGVHLDLSGFTIDGGGDPLAVPANTSRCLDASVGVNVGPNVSNVHINGGTVRGFTFGIQLNTTDRSRVNGMTSARNCAWGVQLNDSDNNALATNIVVENGSTLILPGGFFCGGVGNVCGGVSIQGVSTPAGTQGSSGNDVTSQDLRRNAQFGALIDAASTGNTVRSSDASQTGVLYGFSLVVGIEDGGVNNTIRGNTSNGNNGSGIAVGGATGVVQSNTANGNLGQDTFGAGILIFTSGSGYLIQSNTALNNAGTDLWDLNTSPPCDSNTWKSNNAVTKSPASCVK